MGPFTKDKTQNPKVSQSGPKSQLFSLITFTPIFLSFFPLYFCVVILLSVLQLKTISECLQVHASIVSLLLAELHSGYMSSVVLLKPLTNLCTLQA